MQPAEKRTRRNPQIKKQAREHVLELCQKMNETGNSLIKKDLQETETVNNFMDCVAKVYDGKHEIIEGKYNQATSLHAEMKALIDYIEREKNGFDKIEKIEITSPPCKACAFVLQLHGLLSKVHTTGDIYKEFTGSWRWPSELKKMERFKGDMWGTILKFYDKSGLNEKDVLDDVVKVIQSKSANIVD